MRLIFSTRPAYGHVYPLMPLAGAARQAGHEVEFATAGPFLAKLGSMGVPTHDVGLTIEQGREHVLATIDGDEVLHPPGENIGSVPFGTAVTSPGSKPSSISSSRVASDGVTVRLRRYSGGASRAS